MQSRKIKRNSTIKLTCLRDLLVHVRQSFDEDQSFMVINWVFVFLDGGMLKISGKSKSQIISILNPARFSVRCQIRFKILLPYAHGLSDSAINLRTRPGH